ncbi:MAG: hypothetical protein ABIQ49_15275 [Gemmatimonadales bacterium]
MAGGKGGYRRESLGHRDKKLAMKEARRVAAALETGSASLGSPTVGYLIDLYSHHELPAKKPQTAKWLGQHLGLWGAFVGRHTPAKDLGAREWEAFKRQRLSGAIDGHGKPVEADKRRTVSPGTVNLGLDTLTILCNWATRWRMEGRPLLERSPVWRLPYMDDANPRRAVWTWDRFTVVLAAAERVEMQVDWQGRRERRPSYLADILVIAEGTGRRIGAVRQLRYQDLRLSEGQHGKVQWPADTDKTGKAWLTPVTPAVRSRLLKILRERPGIGATPLFPSPRNVNVPVTENGTAKTSGPDGLSVTVPVPSQPTPKTSPPAPDPAGQGLGTRPLTSPLRRRHWRSTSSARKSLRCVGHSEIIRPPWLLLWPHLSAFQAF